MNKTSLTVPAHKQTRVPAHKTDPHTGLHVIHFLYHLPSSFWLHSQNLRSSPIAALETWMDYFFNSKLNLSSSVLVAVVPACVHLMSWSVSSWNWVILARVRLRFCIKCYIKAFTSKSLTLLEVPISTCGTWASDLFIGKTTRLNLHWNEFKNHLISQPWLL